MRFKQRHNDQKQNPTAQDSGCDTPGAATGTAEAPQESDADGILVHHGIHEGTYRVAGLSVAQARKLFSRPMNIGPDAVAVLHGEVVEDEEQRMLTEEDQVLSFVQRSSVKGLG